MKDNNFVCVPKLDFQLILNMNEALDGEGKHKHDKHQVLVCVTVCPSCQRTPPPPRVPVFRRRCSAVGSGMILGWVCNQWLCERAEGSYYKTWW